MSFRWFTAVAVLGCCSIVGAGFVQGCGGTKTEVGFNNGGGDGGSSSGGSGSSGSSGGTFGSTSSSSGSSGGGSSGGGAACPPGLQCNVSCSGGTTSVSGKVFDPAKLNALYDIAVYVPAVPLTPLPPGVPTGAGESRASKT